MGWNSIINSKAGKLLGLFAVSLGILLPAVRSSGQLHGCDPVTHTSGTGADLYSCIMNSYLVAGVGSGTNVNGSFYVESSPANATNPNKHAITLMFGGPVEAPLGTTISKTSLLMVRVDGGKYGGGSGYDYVFGRQTEGKWLTAPTSTGNHLTARWQTLPVTFNGVTIDPRIEIDLTMSFVHDLVRYRFDVINNSPGQSHTVGLLFVQDIDAGFQDEAIDGPIRLPNQPYLRSETLLQGGQVPPYWDVFVLGPIADSANIPGSPSLRGLLAPINGNATEPTRPTRFAYGDLAKLSGINPNPVTVGTNPVVGRDFSYAWNFTPDSKIQLNSGAIDNAVADFWDPVAVASGQTNTIVTYFGQSTVNADVAPSVSLAIMAPRALGYTSTTDANGNLTGVTSTPSPFTVTAYVQNLTDLTQSGGIPVSPVTLFLDLPPGLALAAGETNPKTVSNLAPGSEQAVSWLVTQVPNTTDPNTPANGNFNLTVTASPNVGSGKSVQTTILIPGPPGFNLPGTTATQGLYMMFSLPLNTGNTLPSTILGLRANQPSPDFDLVRFDPTAGHYVPVNTFTPGYGYWLRSRLTGNTPIRIDSTKYPPLTNQTQPKNDAYAVSYPVGWNQIGNPNIYSVRFSEVNVLDKDSMTLVDVTTAADQLHQWVQPVAFFYDTHDPNPQNWQYVLESNFGFDMIPYQGYWILVKKKNLQFIYPGVDVPGASVTRAAQIGVGLASVTRSTPTNWRLKISARGTLGSDNTTVIGVAQNAADTLDYYKANKPPIQEHQLSLDIIHADWVQGGRYAMDLRSPARSRKTWDLLLTSTKPNETVTLTWPDLGATVPKNYRLSLIDSSSTRQYDLKSNSSVVVTTGADKTRAIQIVAEPMQGSGRALITRLNVLQSNTRGAGAPASVSITYALSSVAKTRLTIRTGAGRALRTILGSTRASGDAPSASGTVVWDMRDNNGASIPSGVYSVELEAESETGEVSRQVQPFLLSR